MAAEVKEERYVLRVLGPRGYFGVPIWCQVGPMTWILDKQANFDISASTICYLVSTFFEQPMSTLSPDAVSMISV